MRSDEAIFSYSGISRKLRAKKHDVEIVKEWIIIPDLGGGTIFTGSDLYHEENSVFDSVQETDIMTLHRRAGENDAFTRFLSGPVFRRVEWLLKKFKVS